METVVNQVTGLHVEPGNSEQIAEAMDILWQNRTLAVDMGIKDINTFLEHFTFSAYVDKFEDHVKSLLRG